MGVDAERVASGCLKRAYAIGLGTVFVLGACGGCVWLLWVG